MILKCLFCRDVVFDCSDFLSNIKKRAMIEDLSKSGKMGVWRRWFRKARYGSLMDYEEVYFCSLCLDRVWRGLKPGMNHTNYFKGIQKEAIRIL